jgi:hypothetical protein
VYGDPALRPLEDLDLLVRPADAVRAGEVLGGLGYRPDFEPDVERPGAARSVRFWKERRPSVSVHLHWDLVNTAFPLPTGALRPDEWDVWGRAETRSVAGAEALVMPGRQAVLYLSEHALKHGFHRLVQLTDVAELLPPGDERGEDAWEGILRDAAGSGYDRPLHHALVVCRDLIGTPVPAAALERTRPRRMTAAERAVLALARRDVRMEDMSYPVYAGMAGGWGARARFVARTFFPPRGTLAALDLVPPEGVGARHYLARVARGLAVGARLAGLSLKGLFTRGA